MFRGIVIIRIVSALFLLGVVSSSFRTPATAASQPETAGTDAKQATLADQSQPAVPIITPIHVDDVVIQSYEGTWDGENNLTPIGNIRFAILFDRQPDNNLLSDLYFSKETMFRFWIRRDEAGFWVLEETGTLDGSFQSVTLHLVSISGQTLTWLDPKRPRYASIQTTVSGDNFDMMVLVKEKVHAHFVLRRIRGDEEAALRKALDQQRTQPGRKDRERLLLRQRRLEALHEAQMSAAASPNDVEIQFTLAAALREVMKDAPPTRQELYARDLLAVLNQALNLSPSLPKAHYEIARYHLEVQPTAEGALDSARREADELAKLGSPLAETVHSAIATLSDGGQPQSGASASSRSTCVEACRSDAE
jgi:hypothetical protein